MEQSASRSYSNKKCSSSFSIKYSGSSCHDLRSSYDKNL